MSWSSIEYGPHWAHAHDTEQIIFMSFAPEFLDSSPFRSVSWLQEWKTYWLEHKYSHGNGCCDIDLATHLRDEERVALFRRFLLDYRAWLSDLGEEIPANVMNAKTAVPGYINFLGPCRVEELIAFVTTIEAVLDGNTRNERVHVKGDA